MSDSAKIRVRFAPSPTGYLHVGSARTFIFNWLFARHTGGTMILRLDDTDLERNTQESVESIFDGLKWLGLDWDEGPDKGGPCGRYRQSERLEDHRKAAWAIFEKGLAYRDFTPAGAGGDRDWTEGASLYNAAMRNLAREESQRRADAGEKFVLRFRVPRDSEEQVRFTDAVYGPQAKATADIEDFALLRSDAGAPDRPASGRAGWGGMPTYHMASCADDVDMRISHIIRGQDHLTNTFKHVQIFRALGHEPPQFAHLPLLVAPDGAKLSKRKHGPVVSVTTYRDAGFLPHAFINFLVLLGWNPKDDRTFMSLEEIKQAFTLENINRANAVVNFKEPAATTEEMFDDKAVWLNSQYIHALEPDRLAELLLPFVEKSCGAGAPPAALKEKVRLIAPLVRERIKLLSDACSVADFFFVKDLAPYDATLLVPQKGDAAMARKVLEKAKEVLAHTEFAHDPLDQALRGAAKELGVKAGQMFAPIRVAVTGRTASPGLFETLAVLGRDVTLERIEKALAKTA
jgi:glutamyl-tRNA synthetase